METIPVTPKDLGLPGGSADRHRVMAADARAWPRECTLPLRKTLPQTVRGFAWALGWWIFRTDPVSGAEVQSCYYGHVAAHDRHGVIAPWCRRLNGQCEFRVRIAAETLKRYPWTPRTLTIAEYPAYVFSGFWQIPSNGVITPRDPGDWGNGDPRQRASSVLTGLEDNYRRTADAAAIAHLTYLPAPCQASSGRVLAEYCLSTEGVVGGWGRN